MRTLKVVLAILALAVCASAQHSATLGTLSATGATAAAHLSVVAHKHTVAAVPTGSPTGCSVKLEGSLDGTTWFDLSTAQTCTSAIMFHVVEKPVLVVRANLTALSGGTAPTVVVKYLGVQ
jgi:hypothetical protein